MVCSRNRKDACVKGSRSSPTSPACIANVRSSDPITMVPVVSQIQPTQCQVTSNISAFHLATPGSKVIQNCKVCDRLITKMHYAELSESGEKLSSREREVTYSGLVVLRYKTHTTPLAARGQPNIEGNTNTRTDALSKIGRNNPRLSQRAESGVRMQ
jgi:hypothetical protein